MTALRDILTNFLVTADYPEVKREGFIKSFYEYLMIRLLEQIRESDPQLHQKLISYFDDESTSDRDIQEGLQEAYQNPELKEKLDKVVDEVIGELVGDFTKYATDDQKNKVLASLPKSV